MSASTQGLQRSAGGDTQTQLRRDIESIKEALLGDDYNKQGLIERFSLLEERLARLEKFLDRSRFALLGLAIFACGGIYEWVKKLVQLLY